MHAAADVAAVGAISVSVYRGPRRHGDMRHPASRPKSSNSMYFRGLQGRYEMAVCEGWHGGDPGAADALKPFSAQIAPLRLKVEAALQECGFSVRESILRTRRIAEELGLEAEFAAMNPFLSKLVHPTASSLFAALQPEQEQLF